MSRFYLDVMHDYQRMSDRMGRECTSVAEARRQAFMSLAEMLTSEISGGGPCQLVVAVRDENFCYMVASITLDKQPITEEINQRGGQNTPTHH